MYSFVTLVNVAFNKATQNFFYRLLTRGTWGIQKFLVYIMTYGKENNGQIGEKSLQVLIIHYIK